MMKHHACQILIALLLFGSLSVIFGAGPAYAQAALTTQRVNGASEVAEEATEEWALLEETMPVNAGQTVRTDFGALTDLLGVDGSFLEIAEATQISVLEYEFNPDQQIRIARFAILEGAVTADAAHLEYPTNVFDIETPTVVASFKFSKLRIKVDKQGSTILRPLSGKFNIGPNAKGKKITGKRTRTVKYDAPDGKQTAFEVPKDGSIDFEITKAGVNVTNNGTDPLFVTVGDKKYTVPQEKSLNTSIGEIGEPSAASDQEQETSEYTVDQEQETSESTVTPLNNTGTTIEIKTQFEKLNSNAASPNVPETPAVQGGVTNDNADGGILEVHPNPSGGQDNEQRDFNITVTIGKE